VISTPGGRLRAAIAITLLAAACSCPRPTVAPEPHYAGFGELTHAVVQGDLPAVAQRAQGLDGGDAVRAVSPTGRQAELDLHSAAGFLMVAMDSAEAGEGLAAVARACGECHAAQGIAFSGSSGGAPETHGARFDASLRALVWPGPARFEAALDGIEAVPFPDGGPGVSVRAQELRQGLLKLDGEPQDRLEGVVALAYGECAGCHGTHPTTGEP